MYHALVLVTNATRVDVSLYGTLLEAQKAAAKRVLKMMRESSALDLGDDIFAMSDAHAREDYAEVVRLFEKQARRQVVFIQTVAAPSAVAACN